MLSWYMFVQNVIKLIAAVMSYRVYRENVKEKLRGDAENNTASTGSNSAGDDVHSEPEVQNNFIMLVY